MRPCWEGEGTRPKGSESEKALTLHDEKMAGYQMRRRYRNTGGRKRRWLKIQWIEGLRMSSEEGRMVYLIGRYVCIQARCRVTHVYASYLIGRVDVLESNRAEISVRFVDCDVSRGWP